MSRVGDLLLEKQAEIDALKRELLARDDEVLRYAFVVLVVGVLLICVAFSAGAGCEAQRLAGGW
ncbi:MAG: hypothetical protein IT209_00565 [Armatimonadetes bacterium]|nr:hypothetical protein [Armatimonadota bacterium]